ncbi:hypothetical protein TYRP_011627 [Tyrophagus putrescentiae]|nr:hypothetical protein TYRP_011627 [Tyrophagus putrescentiae]
MKAEKTILLPIQGHRGNQRLSLANQEGNEEELIGEDHQPSLLQPGTTSSQASMYRRTYSCSVSSVGGGLAMSRNSVWPDSRKIQASTHHHEVVTAKVVVTENQRTIQLPDLAHQLAMLGANVGDLKVRQV